MILFEDCSDWNGYEIVPYLTSVSHYLSLYLCVHMDNYV